MITRDAEDRAEVIQDLGANLAFMTFRTFVPDSPENYSSLFTGILATIEGVKPEYKRVDRLAKDALTAFLNSRNGGGLVSGNPILPDTWPQLPEGLRNHFIVEADHDPAKALVRTIIFGEEPDMIRE